jgi:hypothetical protein
MRSKSLSVILLLLSLAEVKAEDGVGLAPAVAAIFPRGEEVCYLAGPKTTGLKAGHKLSEFYLYKLYRPLHAREEMGPSREDAIAREQKINSSYASLDVVARFRDSPNVYSQSVLCTTYDGGKTISCGVECDGGSFAVDPGNRTLKITIPADGSGLSLNQSCGDPDDEGRERWLTGADAGGSFTLERWPMAHCIAAAEDAHPAFAEDPMPLRERVAVSGWRCLKRVYDAAHLKAHPQQEVVAMSVAIKGPVTQTKDDDGGIETALDVTMSFKLRDGETHRSDVGCVADGYQFRCGDDFRLRRRDGESVWAVAGSYDDPQNPGVRMLGIELGSDDRLFRLNASESADCSIE